MTQWWNLLRAVTVFVTAALWVAHASAAPPPALHRSGTVEDADLGELSGLAASRRVAGRWWGLNDSGHPAELYAFDATGRAQGDVLLPTPAFDWEDLASYRLDGRAWLAVADTGDNFSFRSTVAIYVLPEPEQLDPKMPSRAKAVREIRFEFEDGPRDCESLAADPAHGRFLLIDKGRQPAGLYALPMQPAPGPVIARRIADLPFLWQGPIPKVAPIGVDRHRGSATAMDLSTDGLRLLVLTYRHLALFERRPNEDWPQAIRRQPPKLQSLPRQPILEAAGFDATGPGALVGGEGEHSVLWHWDGSWTVR